MLQPGPLQHHANYSPSVHCVGLHGYGPCRRMQGRQESALLQQESQGLPRAINLCICVFLHLEWQKWEKTPIFFTRLTPESSEHLLRKKGDISPIIMGSSLEKKNVVHLGTEKRKGISIYSPFEARRSGDRKSKPCESLWLESCRPSHWDSVRALGNVFIAEQKLEKVGHERARTLGVKF